MSKEDYFKYYIQGSDHYLLPVEVFNELLEENQELKRQYFKDTGIDADKILELENQQKEFIEYLEDNIKKYENKLEKCPFMAGMLTLPISFWKDELSKFKEITGKDINVATKGDKDER